MALIAAMRQQDVASAAVYRAQFIIQSVVDLPVPVAQSIYGRVVFRKINCFRFLFLKYRHVVRPQIREVIRLFPEIIMIAGNQKNLCVRNLSKKAADLPHLLFQRLCVEKIPRHKQKLRFFSFCHPDHICKRIPDLPRPLLTPRLSLIRLYPEMYVCDMYKFQTASSPFCVNYLYCTLSRHVSQVYPACTLSQK